MKDEDSCKLTGMARELYGFIEGLAIELSKLVHGEEEECGGGADAARNVRECEM